MADRYWVGGSATWDGTAGTKWATTSGGAGGASVPTSADNVYIDANSGSGTVTLANGITCLSLNTTGFTGTISHPAAVTITIGGSVAPAGNAALTIGAGTTYTIGNATTSVISFNSSYTTNFQSITSNGKTLPSITCATGGAGKYQMADNLTMSGTFTFSDATEWDTTSKSWTVGSMSMSSGGTRTLTLGSSAITATGWTYGNVNSLVMTANTAVVTINAATTGFNNIVVLNSKNWNGLSFVFTGNNQATINIANATIGSLTLTGPASKTVEYRVNGSFTMTGTLSVQGNSAVNRVLLRNTVGSAPATITLATLGTMSNVDLMGIVAAGASAPWNLSAITGLSGDGGDNSNITFTSPITCYAVGSASMSWSDTTRWSSSSGGAGSTARVPLPQDNVVFDSNSAFTAGRQITIDMARIGKDISFSSVPNAPNITGSISWQAFGSWSNDGSVTNTMSTVTMTFSGRGTHTFNFGGQSFTNSSLAIEAGSTGSYTFLSAFTTTANGSWTLTSGTVDTAGYTMTAGTFVSSSGAFRVLNTGSSIFAAVATGGVTAMNFSNSTSFTLNASSATLTLVNSASTRTINIASPLVWGTIDYSNSGSTGAMQINNAGTIDTLKFSDASNVRSLLISSTPLINNWQYIFGRSGANITIASNAAGTARTVNAHGVGPHTVNYVTFQDIRISTPLKFYATNSTDNGNNANISFGAYSSGIFNRQNEAATPASNNTVTITFPYATVPGNLLVVSLGIVNNPGTFNAPAGWNVASDVAAGTNSYGKIYYKIADGTETSVTFSWANVRAHSIALYEFGGWTGVPTLDTTDTNSSVSATSLSTGAGATNTGTPALSFAQVASNGGMGATTTPATNSFFDEWDVGVQGTSTSLHLAMKLLASLASQSTTLSWNTSRVPVASLANFKDAPVASNGNFFLMF